MKTNELKCTDLRIGNWVKVNDPIFGVNAYKVATIRDNGIITLSDNISCSVNNIEPIELTEELLVNIGFEKIELVEKKLYMYYKEVRINNYSYLLDFRVMPKDECIVLYVMKLGDDEVDYSTIFYNDNIKYLHQLQNTYYLLTGQEMEVEL